MPTPKRGSPWRGSLMESFWSHSKVAALTPKEMPDALALWTLAHSWVDYQRTDGKVPERTPALLTGWMPSRAHKAAAALVRVGLWDVIPGGWTFHDWSDHNRTKRAWRWVKRRIARRRLWREKPRPHGPSQWSGPDTDEVDSA